MLKYLFKQPQSVNYSDIESHVQLNLSETPNITHHLNTLLDNEIIEKDDKNRYKLTTLGKETVKGIEVFRELLFKHSTIKIRTSRYTFEQFDYEKIAAKLIEEAEMPEDLAFKIAKEVKNKLIEAELDYITAPLIREYVNGILIEKGLDRYRHKLTRLGSPPYDIKKLITSNAVRNPLELGQYLGKNVLEQYSLLNNLIQKYSDLILSGLFTVTDLERFTLTPLELVCSGSNLIQMLSRRYDESDGSNNGNGQNSTPSKAIFSLEFNEFLKNFNGLFGDIKTFFPHGISIIRFDQFLEDFLESYGKDELHLLFDLGFCIFQDEWPITLGVSTQANYIYTEPLLELYRESLKRDNQSWINYPVIDFHVSSRYLKEIQRYKSVEDFKRRHFLHSDLLLNHHFNFDLFKCRGNADAEHIFSNLNIPLQYSSSDSIQPSIILEKISVNLLYIFQKAKGNMDTFFTQLEEAFTHIFYYFEKKFEYICRNMRYFTQWHPLSKIIFNTKNLFESFLSMDEYTYENKVVCAISFHGLDELVYENTGLYIKDQEQNRDLAINIIDYMNDLIGKQNLILNNSIEYTLSESHLQKALLNPMNNILFQDNLHPEMEKGRRRGELGYRLGVFNSQEPLTLKHITTMFQDLKKSRFKSISINLIPVMDLIVQDDSVKCHYMLPLETYKEILTLDVSRIGFNSPILLQQKGFCRYFGPYIPQEEFTLAYEKPLCNELNLHYFKD